MAIKRGQIISKIHAALQTKHRAVYLRSQKYNKQGTSRIQRCSNCFRNHTCLSIIILASNTVQDHWAAGSWRCSYCIESCNSKTQCSYYAMQKQHHLTPSIAPPYPQKALIIQPPVSSDIKMSIYPIWDTGSESNLPKLTEAAGGLGLKSTAQLSVQQELKESPQARKPCVLVTALVSPAHVS